jgi:hypothetical protein
MAVVIDDTSFQAGIKKLDKRMKRVIDGAVADIALEVLRLSQREVPHDIGSLQSTGHTEKYAEFDHIVGYNKVYAAKLHEHPEYRFQKGRKGKYLEDPIKNNISVFRTYFEKAIKNL